MESNLFSSRSNSHGVRSAGFFWHDVLFGAMDWRQYAGGIMVRNVLRDIIRMYSVAREYEKLLKRFRDKNKEISKRREKGEEGKSDT